MVHLSNRKPHSHFTAAPQLAYSKRRTDTLSTYMQIHLFSAQIVFFFSAWNMNIFLWIVQAKTICGCAECCSVRLCCVSIPLWGSKPTLTAWKDKGEGGVRGGGSWEADRKKEGRPGFQRGVLSQRGWAQRLRGKWPQSRKSTWCQ